MALNGAFSRKNLKIRLTLKRFCSIIIKDKLYLSKIFSKEKKQ